MTYMLDTNICIYIIKKKPEKVLERFREKIEEGICISSITLAELQYGIKHSSKPSENEVALLRFILPLNVMPFDSEAATKYGEIREGLQKRGMPIGPMDMLIAAHALSENMILVTNNIREFERVNELKTENWAD